MPANAQIFNPHKRALNKAEKKAAQELKGGADFVIDPIEQVPTKRTSRMSIAAQTNWGKDLLLPTALQERLRNECTYKVTVKVADTGMPDHLSLKQGQLPGANYTGSGTAADAQGHSTHVHGIIAGNELGLCDALVDKGLLTHKAVKILSDNGSGSFAWFQSAVAAERSDDVSRISKGEFVVWNGSFGGGTSLVSGVETELQKSTDAGVVFCFAAGNTGGTGVNYPGCGKYSIACASLDQNQSRSSYSTMGAEVWAAMPGRNINSTYKGQTWAVLSGTSMATPFLTAATAIAYSKWGPRLGKLERVRAYLAWCAKDLGPIGKDQEYGWGIDLISNVLDRDPANTPNLPNDPPPPPPASGQSITPLPVALKNQYKIIWGNVANETAISEPKVFSVKGKGSRAANKALATNETLVSFEVSAPSKANADVEAERLEKAVTDYFATRGFLLPAGQDASWAAYWAAYFLEMGLQTSGDWRVTVTKATLTTSGGQRIGIPEGQLRHWPVKSIGAINSKWHNIIMDDDSLNVIIDSLEKPTNVVIRQ